MISHNPVKALGEILYSLYMISHNPVKALGEILYSLIYNIFVIL